MRFTVSVVSRAKNNQIIGPLTDGSYKIRLCAPAVDGRANEALVDMLAKYFGVSRSAVRIAVGARSRRKIVDISA